MTSKELKPLISNRFVRLYLHDLQSQLFERPDWADTMHIQDDIEFLLDAAIPRKVRGRK
jgi:hypothetical protein